MKKIILILLIATVSQSFGQKTERRKYEFLDNTVANDYNHSQFTEVYFDFDKRLLRVTEGGQSPLFFKVNKIHKNLKQNALNSENEYLYTAYDISIEIDKQTYKLQARLFQDPYAGFFLMYSQDEFKRFYNKP